MLLLDSYRIVRREGLHSDRGDNREYSIILSPSLYLVNATNITTKSYENELYQQPNSQRHALDMSPPGDATTSLPDRAALSPPRSASRRLQPRDVRLRDLRSQHGRYISDETTSPTHRQCGAPFPEIAQTLPLIPTLTPTLHTAIHTVEKEEDIFLLRSFNHFNLGQWHTIGDREHLVPITITMRAVQVAALLPVNPLHFPHVRHQQQHAALLTHTHVAVAHVGDDDADVGLPPQLLAAVDQLPSVQQRQVGGAAVAAGRSQELERLVDRRMGERVRGGGEGAEAGGEPGGERDGFDEAEKRKLPSSSLSRRMLRLRLAEMLLMPPRRLPTTVCSSASEEDVKLFSTVSRPSPLRAACRGFRTMSRRLW